MDRNRKIVIILALVLILLIIIVGLILYFSQKQPVDDMTEQKKPQEVVGPSIDINNEQLDIAETPPPTAEKVQATSAQVIGRLFVERFGTYTNHSDYLSIEDLLPLMTNKMSGWIEETYLPKLREDHPQEGTFYRIFTIAPVANVVEQSDNSAEIIYSCQRTEEFGIAEPGKYKQDIKLELIKSGNKWLVDAAYWQDKE